MYALEHALVSNGVPQQIVQELIENVHGTSIFGTSILHILNQFVYYLLRHTIAYQGMFNRVYYNQSISISTGTGFYEFTYDSIALLRKM